MCISFQLLQIGMALIQAVKADIGRIAEYVKMGSFFLYAAIDVAGEIEIWAFKV